jgi:hypothetical protein
MNYDYSFFESHASRHRRFFGSGTAVECSISRFFKSSARAAEEVRLVQREDGDVFEARGAYFKGGESVAPLESSLRTKLPEDFVQFYEQFGECVIITRSEPILIFPRQQMIDDFKDDVNLDVEEGRFFRFAGYGDPLNLGLRRDDRTGDWQVVICTYGLLYSEMIGPQGRRNVVAPSFYVWLKHLIESDGYPDNIYPRDGTVPYHEVLEG